MDFLAYNVTRRPESSGNSLQLLPNYGIIVPEIMRSLLGGVFKLAKMPLIR